MYFVNAFIFNTYRRGVQYTEELNGNLDSHTIIEVMGLLKASNKKYNQTILRVTHKVAIAQTYDRTIRIEDVILYDGELEFYVRGGEGK